MSAATPTRDEEARINLLHSLQLLDSPPEDVFDRITRLAARLLDAPIALVTLIDRDRLWFKSRIGLDLPESPRAQSFCAHAIHAAQLSVINDACGDARFADNPLVSGTPSVRFYAGAPIFSSRGIALGTLCVMDRRPRTLSTADARTLQDLAELARREIIHRESAQASRLIHQHNHRATEASEARFRATFEQAAVGIALVGTDGAWLRVNTRLCAIVGYTEAELLQLTFQDITYPDDLDADMSLVLQMLKGEIDTYTLEKRYVRKNGELIWINLTVALLRDSAGGPLHFISVVEDIHTRKETEYALHQLQHNLEERVQERTQQLQQVNDRLSVVIEEQRHSEASLRASQSLLHTLANVLPMHISYIDADLTIRFVNAAFRADSELSPDFEVGGKLSDVISRPLYESIQPQLARALAGEQITFDAATTRGRERFWSVVYIPDVQHGAVAGLYIISQDVTAQKQLEASLQRKAMRDSLTGLPNRRALLERLESAASRSDRSGHAFAVLFLDLDGFKAINDRHGHVGGDTLLKHFAQRLKDTVRDSDTVARLAGDEFVIVLEALKNGGADARYVGTKILQAVREPFTLSGEACALSSSIGVYVRQPGHPINATQMITLADQAMYQAKREGKNGMHLVPG